MAPRHTSISRAQTEFPYILFNKSPGANAPTGCPRRQGLRPQPARPPRLGGHTAGNCAAPRGATQDGRASHPLPGHPVPLAARRGKVTPRISVRYRSLRGVAVDMPLMSGPDRLVHNAYRVDLDGESIR